MEGKENSKEDVWRSAILKERELKQYSESLAAYLSQYTGKRENALLLGDASLVQASYLLNKEGFEHIVDVDMSPTLLDEVIFQPDDPRVEKVCASFDEYNPDQNFDLIYGKSIAFNPKETTPQLIATLSEHLNPDGIFFATWGAEGDSYRHGISYTIDELQEIYTNAGLVIVDYQESDEPAQGLMGRKGRKHEFNILARRK